MQSYEKSNENQEGENMKQIKTVFLFAFFIFCLTSHLVARGNSAGTGAGRGNAALTYWVATNSKWADHYNNLGDTPFAKEWQRRTDVKVEFIHPPMGGEREQFNLIVASGDFPDMMESDWSTYPGGPERAISDEIILKLNDIYAKHAPNLSNWLKANPSIDKMIKTDFGSYYVFPYIREMPSNSNGLVVRDDWLKKLNLPIPETIDDWYTVLGAFKDREGAGTPLAFGAGNLISATMSSEIGFIYAYDVSMGFYFGKDNKIHFGPIEEGFKDFLVTMTKWYKEGLLDPDFASAQGAQITAKVTSGETGVTQGALVGGIGAWTPAGRARDPNFSLIGVPNPVLKKGDKPILNMLQWEYPGMYSVVLTTNCRDIERSSKFLDYLFSREGALFSNFGVEGQSYTMVNGKPQYTDFVLKNPDNWSVADAVSAWTNNSFAGPGLWSADGLMQQFIYPGQLVAWDAWQPTPEVLKHRLPPITPTAEESAEFARIMNEINTYYREMMTKYILGLEDLDTFDAYVNTIKRMGIDRAIELQNAALARYNAR
jgi:putative aldouronate transport system substrate-binding protein